MKTLKTLPLVLLMIGFVFCPALSSADDVPSAIKQQEMNGIRYVTGGIGLDERNALKGMEKEYNLKLVFAAVSGQYLSEIGIVIKNTNGNTLLNTTSDGPWFLADLPSGRYKVSAKYKDQQKTRLVEVGKGLQTVLFHWRP